MSELVKLAVKLRAHIEKASESLSDTDAIDAVQLFPAWRADAAYGTGKRVAHKNVLYRCRQAHTSQAIYPPDTVPALWAAVSVSGGTLENPIAAVRGMEYEQGKYYKDPEDGNVYLCTRSGVLQYLPHELIGHYFEGA